MADKSTQLIVEALGRALTEPTGLNLYSTRTAPGLFPATTTAKLAAQRCRDEGWLNIRGDGAREVGQITQKGLDYLLACVSPREVLEDFVRVLEAREEQMQQLLESARQMQATLDGLKRAVDKVLPAIDTPRPAERNGHAAVAEPPLADCLHASLIEWRQGGAPGDCPLPELFRRLRAEGREVSIGEFHDALRRMHDQHGVYLHPWTGPLYDLPEPAFALLVGHEIAYYASPRLPG